MINKFLILCLVVCISCKQDSKKENTTAKSPETKQVNDGSRLSNGYMYKNHTNLAGQKAKPNQIVTIDFHILNDFNEVLSDSRNAGVRPTVQIPSHLHDDTRRNPLLSLISTMVKGDSATVYVPVDSLTSPPEKFLRSENVAYHVKVLNIENEEVYMDRIGAAQRKLREESLAEAESALKEYKSGKYNRDLIEKDHNVKVAIIKNTKGELPNYGDAVSVNYYGFFENGKGFDSSYKVGKPYSFVLGQGSVIPGWDIGIPSVPLGATAILDIPFPQAYGKRGTSVIPPRSNLFFWVKLEAIQKPTIKNK